MQSTFALLRAYKMSPDSGHPAFSQTSPHPVSRLSPPFGLVDLAKEIDQADKMVKARVSAKMQVIADQIRALQEEARRALAEARHDQELHHARCTFTRLPGQVYHLYEKRNGGRYFSMLSPDDWQGKPPHAFVGSFRLETDMSWTPTEPPPGSSICG